MSDIDSNEMLPVPDVGQYEDIKPNISQNSTLTAARAIMVGADRQRMPPLTPVDAAQTIVAPSAAIKAQNWINTFIETRKILDSDYCVE